MRLVIPYSAHDIAGALRLVKWIAFLSSRVAHSMQEESIVLVAAPRAARMKDHSAIVRTATAAFGECTVYVPEEEKEIGWPGSANWMFETALEYVEKTFGDDMLWMEPDAAPLCPPWYDYIKREWVVAQQKGKLFMGNLVQVGVPHMTGIAVYGEDWRQAAPSLVTCPDEQAFDVHSAEEVLPLAHITPLIQHVFHRHEPNWKVPGLAAIDERAVIFHQDKRGILIGLLDRVCFNGDCQSHPQYTYQSESVPVMRKFYRVANATKAVKSGGRRFVFSPLPAFGGAIPGEYSTESEADQATLDDMAQNPASGVTELSQEEWEGLTKKKAPSAMSNTTTSQPLKPSPLNLPIKQTPSKKTAEVVEEPAKSVSENPGTGSKAIKDIDEVLKTAPVKPAQPAPVVRGKPGTTHAAHKK